MQVSAAIQCPIERHYYELLLQPHQRRRSDQLRVVKLVTLSKLLANHQCQCHVANESLHTVDEHAPPLDQVAYG